jgi:hypothetical protein
MLGMNNRSLDGIQGSNLGELFYLPDPVASLMGQGMGDVDEIYES